MTGVIKTFLRFCAVISAPLVLGSCAEEIEVERLAKGEQVNISVSVEQDWDDAEATRAARMSKSDFAGPREAVQFDGTIGDQPVYIWCDELDGIDDGLSPLTAEAPELDDETRGTLMTATGTGAAGDDMSMFHQTFSIYPNTTQTTIPRNTKAERPWSSNRWRVENPFTFPNATAAYTFYAIAPYGAPYTDYSWAVYNYETPEKAVDQVDLMTGTATGIKQSTEEIVFSFRHILSAIRFKMGPQGFAGGYTIKNIELRGVKTEGRFNMTSANGSWVALANTRNINPNQDFNFPITDATYNTMITNDGDATTTGTTFLLIPQTTAFTCAIKLQDADGEVKTITASIPAKQWKPGYTYTYTIASEVDNSTFTLTVNGNPVFNYEGTYQSGGASGATNQYGIISYRKTSKNVSHPVAWEIVKYEYSDDDGATWTDNGTTKPAWLTGLSLESGAGKTSAEYGRVTGIDSQNYIEDKNAERNAKFKTTPVSDYDLSTHDIKGNVTPMNTANCYVISAPGSYKLPLVYGNAIKDGQPNPAAYNYNNMLNVQWNTVLPDPNPSGKTWMVDYTYSTRSWAECVDHNKAVVSNSEDPGPRTATGTLLDSYYLAAQNYLAFVDYFGAQIRDPWIKVNGAQHAGEGIPTSAAVQWTSGDSHIPTNPRISGDYLLFDVPAENLRAGNSQIVVKDESGKIMWSWHLWFAPDDVLDVTEVTNYKGVKYNFAKETMGFVPGTWMQSTYNCPRKIRVTVQQKEGVSGSSPQTAQFIITQNNGLTIAQAYAPIYQWGKKDPYQPPGQVVGTTTAYGSHAPSIQHTILNPHYFYATYSNPTVSGSDTYLSGSKYVECNYGSVAGPGPGPTHLYNYYNRITWQLCPWPRMYASHKAYYFTNLWNASTNNLDIVHDDPVVKTVYDPCPVGFHVPPTNAYSGFTLGGFTELAEKAYTYSGSGTGLNGQNLGSSMWQFYSYGLRGASDAERKNSSVLTYFVGGNFLASSNAPMATVAYDNSRHYMANGRTQRVDDDIYNSYGNYYMAITSGRTWVFRPSTSVLQSSANNAGNIVPVKD